MFLGEILVEILRYLAASLEHAEGRHRIIVVAVLGAEILEVVGGVDIARYVGEDLVGGSLAAILPVGIRAVEVESETAEGGGYLHPIADVCHVAVVLAVGKSLHRAALYDVDLYVVLLTEVESLLLVLVNLVCCFHCMCVLIVFTLQKYDYFRTYYQSISLVGMWGYIRFRSI